MHLGVILRFSLEYARISRYNYTLTILKNQISQIHSRQGYSLVELLTVLVVVGILAMVAVPNFLSSYHRLNFQNTVKSVAALYERARTQALASKIDAAQKMPPGGYGVWLGVDGADNQMKAILFINDWNTVGGSVKMDYTDAEIDSRVVPDAVFTKPIGVGTGDTVIDTVIVNDKEYVKLSSLKGLAPGASNWATAPEIMPGTLGITRGVTTIFMPPFAETKIDDAAFSKMQAVFTLGTSATTRTLTLDRVMTTPQVTNP